MKAYKYAFLLLQCAGRKSHSTLRCCIFFCYSLFKILSKNDHLITSTYEHPSILNVAKALSQKGIEVNFSEIKNSNHFFKDKEEELKKTIDKYIKDKTQLI